MEIMNGALLGALAAAAGGGNDRSTIEKLVAGFAPWAAQYIGPIAVGVGVVLIIVAVVQLGRYIAGKSNGGGQSRVSIGWTIGLFVIGGALLVGGATFTHTLIQGADSIVNNVTTQDGGVNGDANNAGGNWDQPSN